LLYVYRGHFGHHDVTVAVPSQHETDRHGDLVGRQARAGHLIEQRMEDRMIGPVNNGNADRRVAQSVSSMRTAKTSTDD